LLCQKKILHCFMNNSKSIYIIIIFLRSNYLFQLNFHNNCLAKIITNSLKLCYIFFISKLKFHEHFEFYNSELLYWKRRQSLELCIPKFYCIQTLVQNSVYCEYLVVQDCWKQESEKERIVLLFHFVGNHLVVQDCWKQESEKERIVLLFHFVKVIVKSFKEWRDWMYP
jgi:hypothetical protein